MLRWGDPMHLMGRESNWVRKRLGIGWANRDYAIVTEVVINILELEAWNELVKERSAFVDLSLNKLSVSTGFQRLAVPVFLVALDA